MATEPEAWPPLHKKPSQSNVLYVWDEEFLYCFGFLEGMRRCGNTKQIGELSLNQLNNKPLKRKKKSILL